MPVPADVLPAVTIAFDTLKLADRLEAGGFTAEQAKTAASALSDAFEETITVKDLDRATERIDASIAALRQHVDAELKSRDQRIDARFDAVDARFENLEQRVDARFESLEQRVDARFENLEQRVNARFEALDARLDAQELRLVVKMGGMLVVMVGVIAALFKLLH